MVGEIAGNSSPDNEALMCAVFRALGRGRPEPLLDALHEDVVWKAAVAQKGLLPFGGEYRGRAGVAQFLAHFAKRYAFRQFEAREVLSREEVVWGLFDVQIEHIEERGSVPKILSGQVAARWRVRDNKILEHQGFGDILPLFLAALPAEPRSTG